MNYSKFIQARAIFFSAGLLVFGTAAAVELTVVVENVKSEQGYVRAGLFNTAQGFPKTPFIGQHAAAKAGSVNFTFKNIPEGSYAVSAYHDLNDNEKLDTNFVGKPVEPYGFSRNARGTFGPPVFDDAVIQLDAAGTSVSFSVK